MKKIFVFIAQIVLTTSSAFASILPPNNLHLHDGLEQQSNITEEQFSALIDQATSQYEPIVQQLGKKLVVNKDWNSSVVNATAQQMEDDWQLNFFGGLARRPEMDADSYTMVICHELGHHLGGFPFYPTGLTWAASEGQADYFASQTCLKKLWEKDLLGNMMAKSSASAYAIQYCDSQWPGEPERLLCYRTLSAGIRLSHFFGMVSTVKPMLETAETKEVMQTYPSHPGAQCRLDTFVAGAVCKLRVADGHIPGKSTPAGLNNLQAETEAFAQSCYENSMSSIGARPRCWFRQNLPIAPVVLP